MTTVGNMGVDFICSFYPVTSRVLIWWLDKKFVNIFNATKLWYSEYSFFYFHIGHTSDIMAEMVLPRELGAGKSDGILLLMDETSQR